MAAICGFYTGLVRFADAQPSKWTHRSQSYFTTDSLSICLGIEPTLWTFDQTLLPFQESGSGICCPVSVRRPLWREDRSAIYSVITQWSESLRTRNHTLLSHLRLPQPGEPGSGVEVTLRLTVSQSVSMSWYRAHSWTCDQILLSVERLRSCFCGAHSLMRGRVCNLQCNHSMVLWDLRQDITSCRIVAVWNLLSYFCEAPSLTRGRVCNLQLRLSASTSLTTIRHTKAGNFREEKSCVIRRSNTESRSFWWWPRVYVTVDDSCSFLWWMGTHLCDALALAVDTISEVICSHDSFCFISHHNRRSVCLLSQKTRLTPFA
jgi:hypothetical protein